MSSLELKVPPLALLAAFGAVMFGLSLSLPGLALSIPQGSAIAIALVVVGACFALAGVAEFRTRKTTVNPTTPEKSSAIVSQGIYGFTRNPMYLGFALVLAGWAIYLANSASLLAVPAFVLYMNQFQIKPEERTLLRKFGAPFAEYMASVRRWV